MLQLVLDLPPHPHQLVAMQQQLAHVALLRVRHPQPRKTLLAQQLQQQLRVPPVRLLLAPRHGPDLARIPQPQLMPALAQQPLEPQRVAARLHPHQNRPGQLAIELGGLAWQQSSFLVLSAFCIQPGDLLKARMKITAYNLHDGSFRSESWFFAKTQVYSALLRSRRCYPIKRPRFHQRAEGSRVQGMPA